MRVNIAIKPSQEVIEEAIALSKQISNEADAYFVLDNINLFPHITIEHIELPDGNVDKIFDMAEKIAAELKPFTASFTGPRSNIGFIDIALEKTAIWDKLNVPEPHMTLSRLKDEALATTIAQKLTFPIASFDITNVTVYSLGDHGTCTGILKEYSLVL